MRYTNDLYDAEVSMKQIRTIRLKPIIFLLKRVLILFVLTAAIALMSSCDRNSSHLLVSIIEVKTKQAIPDPSTNNYRFWQAPKGERFILIQTLINNPTESTASFRMKNVFLIDATGNKHPNSGMIVAFNQPSEGVFLGSLIKDAITVNGNSTLSDSVYSAFVFDAPESMKDFNLKVGKTVPVPVYIP